MCDTFASISPSATLFAKNSDRDPLEPQVVEARPPRFSSGTLRTQYLDIPNADAYGVVLSRPTWLWGAEHGLNEHGLAVGNERVYSNRDLSGPQALLGMDLVRLTLERARNAEEGVDVLAGLLSRHGQGGSGYPDHDESYDSSFLLADRQEIWVVETSGRDWVAAPFSDHAAISNRYTLGADWTRTSGALTEGQTVETWHEKSVDTRLADHRLAATSACSMSSPSPAEAVATQRFHGTIPWGAPGRGDKPEPPPAELGDDLSGVTVCMHIPGFQATTASLVCSLPADGSPIRSWASLGSPCCGVYVPFIDLKVPSVLSDLRQATRFTVLRDRIDNDHDELVGLRATLDPFESEMWEEADSLTEASPSDWVEFGDQCGERLDQVLTGLGV